MLAWQYGHNLGHLSRLLAIARLVQDHGGEPVWVVPAAFLASPHLLGRGLQRLQAPMVDVFGAMPEAVAGIQSFADILCSFGFGDGPRLLACVCKWATLIDHVRPISIVLDYAPVAQIAAHLRNLPAYQVTNGFDAPPPDCPVIGLTMRGPYLDLQNARKVAALDRSLSLLGREFTGRNITLRSVLGHARKVYDCIPETDAYGPRFDGLHVGPLLGLADPSTPSPAFEAFLAAGGGPRIFAYARNQPGTEAMLHALVNCGATSLCVWPDAPLRWADRSHGKVFVQRAPVDLRQAVAAADLVVHYGSVTTLCQTLLMGRPQWMHPQDLEKRIVSRKVQTLGAGLIASAPSTRSAQDVEVTRHVGLPSPHAGSSAQAPSAQLQALLDVKDYAAAAMSISRRHAQTDWAAARFQLGQQLLAST